MRRGCHLRRPALQLRFNQRRAQRDLDSGRRGALDAFLVEMERKPDPQVLQLIGKSVADLLMAKDPEKYKPEIARIRERLK